VVIKTSVENKKLSAEVWIHNNSTDKKEVVLSSALNSWNERNWYYPKLEPVTITLDKNEIKKIILEPVSWNLGKESYWWPNKPFREDYKAQLHNLNLSISENGTEFDSFVQRFGFVEWTEGPNYYMVNGVRINQIGDGTPESAMSDYDCYNTSPAFLPPTKPGTGCPETWKKFMRLGINVNRIHQSTPTQYMMDVADELGFMLVPETPIRGCQKQDWSNLKPFIQSVKEMTYYSRNHPSVCRYSLLNEGSIKYLPELIDAIVEKDSTRPLSFDDNVLRIPTKIKGKTSNAHAYAINHYQEYPKPATIISGMGEYAWYWDDHKPRKLANGELGLPPTANGGLEEFIYYGGDMRRWDIAYFAGWDFINYWPNFLEGMNYKKHAWKQSCYPKDREDGIDGWNSQVISWMQKYFHPYLVMDLGIHEINKESNHWPENTDSYKSGETIVRKLEVFNDGLQGENFKIEWEARWDSAKGKKLMSGQIENIIIAPGFHKTLTLSVKVPRTDSEKRKLFLILTSKLNDKVVFKEDEIYYMVQH
jgi:hypothetical protein